MAVMRLLEKAVQIGLELQPLLLLKIHCGPFFYCELLFSVTCPSRLLLAKCESEPDVTTLKACSGGQTKKKPKQTSQEYHAE